MENHHHHHHHHYDSSAEASLLQAFRSYISISKLLKSGSDFVSISLIENCFDYLFTSKKAFAKLIVEIDYPRSKWAVPLIEEYLNYSLRLLDLLNSVKYSIYHVGQARVSITHALSLLESSDPLSIQRLRLVEFKKFDINLKLEEDMKERTFLEKESVIHQALMEMKKNSDLIIGTILSSLSGDQKPYKELKKCGENSKDFGGFIEKNVVLKEFKEINEAKACLEEAMEMGKIRENCDGDMKKLEIKLVELQKQLDDIGNKAEDMFSEILAGRNEALDILKHQNQET